MYIPLGQGFGNMCVAGSRNGANVNITGQGWDTGRDCPRDSQSPGCENYSGQRRIFSDPGDINLNLEINKCASMEVTHKGETLTTNLTQCSVSLNLNATKSNDITVGANGGARLNVGKNCGPVTITMSGSPTVTKDPYGSTYSIEGSNGEFITLNATQIGQVTINGKAMSSYLPPEPVKEPDPNAAPAEERPKRAPITGADIISGRYRNGMNGGSSFGNYQNQGSQTSNSQSSEELTTAPQQNKSSGAKSGLTDSVVNTTVALDATAQKSQNVTTATDSSVNEQASQAEIDAKMSANAAAQASSGASTPAAQNMFSANMPMIFPFIYMLMGMFRQQGSQQNQPLSPYQQNNYLPW